MSRSAGVGAPEHLTERHDVAAFDSGTPDLDAWLKRRALANEASGGSRTYVIGVSGRVVGFYALATGAVAHDEVTGRVRRNMPDPIPVMVLARLAVDRAYQGQGLGRALLRDALQRTWHASEIVGIRAVLVHALSPAAKKFYVQAGFAEAPVSPMTLMVTMTDVARFLRS